MTFAPRKKHSKTRTGRRTSNWIKLTARKLKERTSLQYDEQGNAIGLSHFANVSWMYKWRQVYKVRTKKAPKIKTLKA